MDPSLCTLRHSIPYTLELDSSTLNKHQDFTASTRCEIPTVVHVHSAGSRAFCWFIRLLSLLMEVLLLMPLLVVYGRFWFIKLLLVVDGSYSSCTFLLSEVLLVTTSQVRFLPDVGLCNLVGLPHLSLGLYS